MAILSEVIALFGRRGWCILLHLPGAGKRKVVAPASILNIKG
jgi:hypothetical protein